MTRDELYALAETERAAAPGWCSAEKARALVDCVLAERPSVVVEVGVFGGASLLPLALAVKYLGHGVVYGVDPFDRAQVLEGVADERNREWWSAVDLESAFEHLMKRLYGVPLGGRCFLMPQRSQNGSCSFPDGKIGLLHLDANHSEQPSLRDATLWLPKVRPGGVIFFDDLSWRENGVLSTRAALSHLLRNGCTMTDVVGDCGVLRKG